MSNGEPYHRTIGQVDGALHESLAKGAASHDESTVLVLDGTCHNLCGRGCIFIYEHYDTSLFETAVAVSTIVTASLTTSLSIDE